MILKMLKILLKLLYTSFGIIVVAIIADLTSFTTYPFKQFTIAPPRALQDELAPNELLNNAHRVLNNEIDGPECLISRGIEMFTGLNGGKVIKVSAGLVEPIFQIGQNCANLKYYEEVCGRPLGLAFDTKGNNIIVADAYYGLWLVDLNNYNKKLLVSPKQLLPGKRVNRRARIFNGVAVDSKGIIYWTDSSSDFQLQDTLLVAMANPSARLFKYDRTTNNSLLLLDELFYANGLALSSNEDFLVVAETGFMRLVKYFLKGERAGQSEIFIDKLPGHPNKLTADTNGLWIPLIIAADSAHLSEFVIFSKFPYLRKQLMNIILLCELPFQFIEAFIPNRITKSIIYWIGHSQMLLFMKSKRTTIVRVDWEGNIVSALHGFDGSASYISHVLEYNNALLLGSPINRYIVRVFLN